MATIRDIQKAIRAGKGIGPTVQEVVMPSPPSSPEKKVRREWVIGDLEGDFTDQNIIANLTNTEDYKYNKSGRELVKLFRVLVQDAVQQSQAV